MPDLTISGTPTFNANDTCTINDTGPDTVDAPSSLLDVAQAWVAVRVKMGFSSAAPPGTNTSVCDWQESTALTNYIWCHISSGDGKPRLTHGNSGDQNLVYAGAVSYAVGDDVTLIYKWTGSQLGVSFNGSAFTTVARTKTPSNLRSTFEIGWLNGYGRQINSDVHWFACGRGTLSDGDAARIHAFGNQNNGLHSWPGDCRMVWFAQSVSYLVPPALTAFQQSVALLCGETTLCGESTIVSGGPSLDANNAGALSLVAASGPAALTLVPVT